VLPTPSSRFQFAVTRDVAADASTVFEVLTSEAGMMQWIWKCRSAEWRHPAGVTAPGIGSIRHIVLAGGLVASERIVAWDEGRGLHYTFAEASMPVGRLTHDYVGVTTVEPLGPGRARLEWSVHFDPAALPLAASLVRLGLRPAIGLMAGNIVRVAEAR
jgi:hypothetical protein